MVIVVVLDRVLIDEKNDEIHPTFDVLMVYVQFFLEPDCGVLSNSMTEIDDVIDDDEK